MSTAILMNDPQKFEEFVKKLFDRQDKNKDGTLDFNEIKELLQIYTNCSEFELAQEFRKLDRNNDGVLSFYEFKIMFGNVLNRFKQNKKKYK